MPKEDREKELEEKVRGLEEEIERLKSEKRPDEEESVAGGLLKGVGETFGLGGLLKGIETSQAFNERLKKIDQEIEGKFSATPLKTGGLRRPAVRDGFGARPLTRARRPVTKTTPPSPKERDVDIFDEDDHVLIVAEIPGAVEERINARLNKDKLTISADRAGKKYHKELILPCVPEGELTKTYKNGILEVKIEKERLKHADRYK